MFVKTCPSLLNLGHMNFEYSHLCQNSPYKALLLCLLTSIYTFFFFCLWLSSSAPVVLKYSKMMSSLPHALHISICHSTSTSHSYPFYSAQGQHQWVPCWRLQVIFNCRGVWVLQWEVVECNGTGDTLKEKRRMVFWYLFPNSLPAVTPGWLSAYSKSHNGCQTAFYLGSDNFSLPCPFSLKLVMAPLFKKLAKDSNSVDLHRHCNWLVS